MTSLIISIPIATVDEDVSGETTQDPSDSKNIFFSHSYDFYCVFSSSLDPTISLYHPIQFSFLSFLFDISFISFLQYLDYSLTWRAANSFIFFFQSHEPHHNPLIMRSRTLYQVGFIQIFQSRRLKEFDVLIRQHCLSIMHLFPNSHYSRSHYAKIVSAPYCYLLSMCQRRSKSCLPIMYFPTTIAVANVNTADQSSP